MFITLSGVFGEFLEANQLLDSFLLNNDYYLLTADWSSYLDAQERVDKVHLRFYIPELY